MTSRPNKNAGFPDRNKIKSLYAELRPHYDETLQALYRRIRFLLERHGHSPTIKYRVKRFENYFDKLVKNSKRPESENSEISDLLGLRIICPFLEDLERVESLLCDNFEVLELEKKGTRHSFREFGYDSVHFLIKLDSNQLPEKMPGTSEVCEIQLRTILQDAWAEVEHELIYKSDISLPNESIKRKLASLNATLTLSDLIFQEIRDDQKEIRERDRRRRQSLEERFHTSDPISIAHLESLENTAEKKRPEERPARYGNRVENTMLEALDAHSRNDFQAAIGLYTQLLRMKLSQTHRSLVYNHRGMAHFALADYRKALDDFTRAISLDGKNMRGYNNRALTFRVLHEPHLSLKDYDHSLELNPSQADAYFGRAQTYCAMKLFTSALADCEKVLQIQADHQPALNLMQCIRREIF